MAVAVETVYLEIFSTADLWMLIVDVFVPWPEGGWFYIKHWKHFVQFSGMTLPV